MPRYKLPLDPNRLCPRGHVGKRAKNGQCLDCCNLRAREKRAKLRAITPPKKRKISITQIRALDPNRLCARGHSGDRYPDGKCRTCLIEKKKQWKKDNPERARASSYASARRVRLRDVEAARERERKSRQLTVSKDPEKFRQKARKWRKSLSKEKRKQYYQSRYERGAITALGAARRAAKLNATPSWSDITRIKEIYGRARRLSECLKVKMNVDHIVPLISSKVCGLHVPANLRIITKDLNSRKGNKVWPDMTTWST